jgi:hypothetical protein
MSEMVSPPASNPATPPPADEKKQGGWTIQRIVTIAAVGLGGIIVVLFVIGLLLALFSDAEVTAARVQVIRDVFIILMALEFILIIAALAILILQVARLINLLQNEVKPVLDNTQETITTARGTVEFVSKTVARPVIATGAFLAGANVFLREFGGIRRAVRRNTKERA